MGNRSSLNEKDRLGQTLQYVVIQPTSISALPIR